MTSTVRKLPGEWAREGGVYDCTGFIGPQLQHSVTDVEWPMYSFDRPAFVVWNAIAANLHARGWTDAEIKDWLQSKCARWALDGELTAFLTEAASRYADKHITSKVR